MPRGAAIFSTEDSLPIRWWLYERRDEIKLWSRAKRVALLCHAVALGKKTKTKKNIGRGPRAVSLCATGCPLPAPLLAPFPRSLLLNRTETLATRAMADREGSVALCYGVVSLAAVFSIATQRSSPQGGALRDDTKNGCEGDYATGWR